MSKSATMTWNNLAHFKPEHSTLVGIDSDGCVFDTMQIKQKQCFHGLIVSHWGLEPIAPLVRETAEFVNLNSRYRGNNRFVSLLRTFDLLRERPEAIASGVPLPEFQALRDFIASGRPLGHPALEQRLAETGNAELASLLAWSKAVNRAIAKTVTNAPPYPWVVKSLKKIRAHSDAICVSQTPAEALAREWRRHGLTGYVKVIAGQELGTKADHLRLAAAGRYLPDNILMIGDAPGDLAAARANRAHFYPINPGHEPESWKRFYLEAYAKFLNHTYGGCYEAGLIAAFDKLLPATPPWHSARRR